MKESLGSFWDEWEKETELEEKKLKEMQDKIHKQYLENMQEEKQMKQEQIRKMQKRYNFSIEDERIQIALERLQVQRAQKRMPISQLTPLIILALKQRRR